MRTPKNQEAIADLVGTNPAKPVKRSFGAEDKTPAGKPDKEKMKPFTSLISKDNDLRFAQYLHHRPGQNKKVAVFNAALKLFFDTYPQFSNQPIPKEV